MLGFYTPPNCTITTLAWPENADSSSDIKEQEKLFKGNIEKNFLNMLLPMNMKETIWNIRKMNGDLAFSIQCPFGLVKSIKVVMIL